MSQRSDWSIPHDVTYLNHGSFGPTPLSVAAAREEWSRRLAANPMEFYLRRLDAVLDDAAGRLGQFIGADARDLVFVDNATVAMNVVADTVSLQAGDEILLNDHEYGAVFRIWRRVCERTGAKIVSPTLGRLAADNGMKPERSADVSASQPARFENEDDIVKPIIETMTPRTKLVVISHVTSPTAIVFPVERICEAARQRGIPSCIDGPHAIAMRDVDLRKIGCDFYCASLHKWLSAPLGSGFLYVRPKWQQAVSVPVMSWGRSLGGCSPRWQDQLNWLGTRDPAPFLAVPAAIDFLEKKGLDSFRQTTHELAQYAKVSLESVLGTTATIPNSIDWYGSMIAVPVPSRWNPVGTTNVLSESPQPAKRPSKKSAPNAIHPLQARLWQDHKIEALVTECHGVSYLRVSCHLYNGRSDIDRLVQALKGQ